MAVLEDLPSFKPPLDYLLELLPRFQSRYYSISSSPKVQTGSLFPLASLPGHYSRRLPPSLPPSKMYPDSIHITAVLVEYETRTKRTNKGVTTSWLKRMEGQTTNGKFTTV